MCEIKIINGIKTNPKYIVIRQKNKKIVYILWIMSITEATGSSLIIWFRNKHTQQISVLVGKESNYIEDNTDVCRLLFQHGVEIKRAQTFVPFNPLVSWDKTEEIKRSSYFRKMAQKIENILHTEVRYDTPQYNSLRKEWTVHYRYLSGIRKGIVKGGRNTKTELPLQTIKRECCEELFQCADFPMTYLGVSDHYAVFFHQIYQLSYIRQLMAEIRKRSFSKYGEMWDFEFVPIETILENRKEYNKKTVGAIELFCQSVQQAPLSTGINKHQMTNLGYPYE